MSTSEGAPRGFSRGDVGPAPPSKNRKPKPKPSAQRPSVRPTKAPTLARQEAPSVLKGVSAQDVTPNSPCGCGSGLEYRQCCGVQHLGLEQSNTPDQVLRARYTAFKYGIADYIIDSSHPTAEDYQRYMVEARASKRSGSERWKREILQLSHKEGLLYLGLEVVSTEVTGDFATVIFRALFRQEDGAYMAVEENALFRRCYFPFENIFILV